MEAVCCIFLFPVIIHSHVCVHVGARKQEILAFLLSDLSKKAKTTRTWAGATKSFLILHKLTAS